MIKSTEYGPSKSYDLSHLCDNDDDDFFLEGSDLLGDEVTNAAQQAAQSRVI